MTVCEPNHSREPRPLSRKTWYWLFGVLLTGVAFIIVAVLFYSRFGRSHDDWMRSARRSFLERDYHAAETFARRALSQQPRSMPALRLAAESAVRLGDVQRAVGYFEQIHDGSPSAVEARCAAGELLLEHKQASRALDQFLRAVQQQADNLLANQRLAFLYGMAGRNWEALPYRLFTLRQKALTSAHVFAVSLGDDFRENPDVLLAYHRAVPTDPLASLGLARAAMTQKRYAEAKQLLQQVVQSHFELNEAQVNLGRVLLELKQYRELAKWHERLATAADDHPGMWTVRGRWAQRRGHSSAAIRCWAEAVLRDPNLPEANYQLGQLLVSTGHERMARPFLKRSQRLRKYANTCYGVVTHGGAPSPQSVRSLRRAAQSAETLGLLWEAAAWTRLTLNSAQSLPGNKGELRIWATETLARLDAELPKSAASRAIPEANPARDFPLANFPRFEPSGDAPRVSAISQAKSASGSLRFRNDAPRVGVDFTYFNDGAPLGPGRHRMYEFTGGGVGVLDYDLDGWPDLYFTQGCRWPPQDRQTAPVDALFNNRDGGRFENVTDDARLRENRYSQGVSVGDFNNDGFPDIYVGNIGPGRLLRNNGDGTFSDVSGLVRGDQARWTTSCLLADLNGDALPDIYAVNYLAGKDVFSRVCMDINGSPQTCLPQNFAAAQDQIFVNRGDGRFAEVTNESGFAVPDGKGLGIVAADFQTTGQLSVFIANDEAPNFLFTPSGRQTSMGRRFVERALPVGLALNRLGRPEACMGIAAGDANGDGLIDLFVTNFEHESNTLYLQRPGMMFVDATDQFGLSTPSLPLLGFGTQFLDADLDGDLDLIVANGHIQIQSTGHERMPPQVFSNREGKRFQLLPAQQVGEYFRGRYLGRGMARLDWNRDGREDIAISHLDAPVALLTNATSSPGHCLSVRLVGVSSSRDAIGATVTARLTGRVIVRQLTAGDGYQSSNERLVTLGLGELRQVDTLHIRWPSGEETTFANVPADVELLCVEHRRFPVLRRLSGYPLNSRGPGNHP